MDDMFADVIAFHNRFNCHRQPLPTIPPVAVSSLRYELMREELAEILDGMLDNDLPAVADGIVDLIYVALGTAIAYGIDVRPVWDEVHAANMAKIGAATRGDGKVLKPPGWVPPNVAAVLAGQVAIPEIIKGD